MAGSPSAGEAGLGAGRTCSRRACVGQHLFQHAVRRNFRIRHCRYLRSRVSAYSGDEGQGLQAGLRRQRDTVTSSIAGIVIPPSHNMIIFVVAAGGGISISKLFLAGVIPGILMCLCLAVAAYVVALKHNYGSEPFPWLAGGRANGHCRNSRPDHGGDHCWWRAVRHLHRHGVRCIRCNIRAPSHRLAYRTLDWDKLRGFAVTSALRTTAMVMILIGFASSFAYLLALYQVPAKLSDFPAWGSPKKRSSSC